VRHETSSAAARRAREAAAGSGWYGRHAAVGRTGGAGKWRGRPTCGAGAQRITVLPCDSNGRPPNQMRQTAVRPACRNAVRATYARGPLPLRMAVAHFGDRARLTRCALRSGGTFQVQERPPKSGNASTPMLLPTKICTPNTTARSRLSNRRSASAASQLGKVRANTVGGRHGRRERQRRATVIPANLRRQPADACWLKPHRRPDDGRSLTRSARPARTTATETKPARPAVGSGHPRPIHPRGRRHEARPRPASPAVTARRLPAFPSICGPHRASAQRLPRRTFNRPCGQVVHRGRTSGVRAAAAVVRVRGLTS